MFNKVDYILSHISCGTRLIDACRLEGLPISEFMVRMGLSKKLGRNFRSAVAVAVSTGRRPEGWLGIE